MARRRASMREGPLAELFRATEPAQRQAEQRGEEPPPAQPEREAAPATEPEERTVEHVPSWEEATQAEAPVPPSPRPDPMAPPPPPTPQPPVPSPSPEPTPPPQPPDMRRKARAARKAPALPEQPARLHVAPRSDAASYLAVIKVVGVGGAGLNAVNRMID